MNSEKRSRPIDDLEAAIQRLLALGQANASAVVSEARTLDRELCRLLAARLAGPAVEPTGELSRRAVWGSAAACARAVPPTCAAAAR